MGADTEGASSFEGAEELRSQNQVVGEILRRMLQNGVSRHDWSAKDFEQSMLNAGYTEYEHGSLFEDLMTWLQAESVIRFGQTHDDGEGGTTFCECALTGAGMNLLQTRTPVFGDLTPAEVLMSKDSGAPASQYVRLGGFIGGVIGGFTKAAG